MNARFDMSEIFCKGRKSKIYEKNGIHKKFYSVHWFKKSNIFIFPSVKLTYVICEKKKKHKEVNKYVKLQVILTHNRQV